jgi:acid stress-induced BolA-like protein IbaG/YrbA
MNMKEKVKKILQDLPLSHLEVEIEPEFGPRVVAVVISDEFERMDEGERQCIVWKKLLDELDPYEQTWVEFVHTMAPSELEPAHDAD